MPLSDSQLQDLYNKVNITYNVVSNNLNSRISDVISNVLNTTNSIQNRITQSQTQATSLTQYAINQTAAYITSVNQNINKAVGQIYTDINTSNTTMSQNIQAKINAISQDIQKKSDSISLEIQKKVDALNADLQSKITSMMSPILQEIDKNTATVTANIQNLINNAETDIKSSNIATQNIVKSTTDKLNSAIQALSATTAQLNNNSTPVNPSTDSIFGITPPTWLDGLLQDAYSRLGGTTPPPADTIWEGLIRIVSGNATADTFHLLDKLDITGSILDVATKLGTIETNVVNGRYKTLDDLNKDLKGLGLDNNLIGTLIQLAFSVANIDDIAKTLFIPTITKLQQLLVAAYSLKQLNEADLLQAYIRNNMSPEDVKKNLDNLGHSQADSDLLMKNVLPRYNIEELFRLGYLGKMNGDDLTKYMRTLGWNEQDTIRHGYLNQPRPGIQDLITFAVKEVYSPDVYEKFGQYQDVPSEFIAQAKLLGLDENFARQYWAAHWQLPGAVQGFDMFHRGIITHDDLVTLLKSLDVMPFWRDKLIQLSYNIVARVDTRRLYAYGIWDATKVYNNYLAEGYSPSDAKDLTNFTIQYDNEQDSKHKTALQNKSKNVYIKSYLYGLIDQNTAQNKIVALGYKSEDVQLELAIEKYEQYVDLHKPKRENHVQKVISLSLDGYKKRAVSRADLLGILTTNGYTLSDANIEADLVDKEANIAFKESVVKEIQKLYFESLLDDNAALTKLIQLGFANSEALNIISELQIMKALDDKKPTPAQFKTMFEDGIITENDYSLELANMGYNAKYIPNIISLSVGKK